MLNSVDKELVKNRFEKSIFTYDKNAIVQKHMAAELLAALIGFKGRDFNKILEIGCGTGFLSKEMIGHTELRSKPDLNQKSRLVGLPAHQPGTENALNATHYQLNFDKLFANDIVEESVNQIKLLSKKIEKLDGDCENILFPSNLDLIISNATFQWIEDFISISEKIHLSLKAGGVFAFSTFEKQNLYQIKTITGKSLNYYAKLDIENILSNNFEVIFSHSEEINIEFDSVHEILTHLKLSGVNSLGTTKWTKCDLKGFESKYNKLFRNDRGKLILTYKPMYFICAKINF